MKRVHLILFSLFLPFVLSGCGAAKSILFSSGSALFDNHMVDARSIAIDISPQGQNIIFSANGVGGAGIFCLNLKSLKVSTITDTKLYESDPTVVPQSMDVVFTVAEKKGARLYILHSSKQTRKKLNEYDQLRALKNEQAAPLTQTRHNEQDDLSYFDTSPVASPDGRFIYFMRAQRNRDYSMGGTIWVDWDLYKLQLSNKETIRLTHSNFRRMSSPQVLPKTGEVILSYKKLTPPAAENPTIEGVMIIDQNNAIRRLFPKDLVFAAGICFGESQDQLIFISNFKEDSNYELCSSDMSFSNPHTLTNKKSNLLMPRYNRQKKTIYFLNDPNYNGRYQLWYLPMKPNGSGQAQELANATLFTEPLKWKP